MLTALHHALEGQHRAPLVATSSHRHAGPPLFVAIGRVLRRSLTLATLTACRSADRAGPPATVSFVLEAPFCSSRLPAEFLVDGRTVGVDTFRVHLPPDHIVSRPFAVSPGAHVIGARVTLGTTRYTWPDAPDTVVTLHAGVAFRRVLPFYCS